LGRFFSVACSDCIGVTFDDLVPFRSGESRESVLPEISYIELTGLQGSFKGRVQRPKRLVALSLRHPFDLSVVFGHDRGPFDGFGLRGKTWLRGHLKARRTEIASFTIDAFHVMGGCHYATPIEAMTQSQSVA
jgi:hypothetical protein